MGVWGLEAPSRESVLRTTGPGQRPGLPSSLTDDIGTMAVYTDVSDSALTSFLGEYDIGALVAFRGIAEGVENSNFSLRTTAGDFILTLYEKRVDPADLPWFIGLMRHLASQGISCPLPVAGRDGEALRRLCGRHAAVTTFLPGVWPRRPQPAQCGELGVALARLHLAGEGFSAARANALGPASWAPLLARCGDADAVQDGLGAALAAALAGILAAWPADLPVGQIHADLFPDNVFFLGDRLSGLIDFYFACTDILAYDVAVCLNAWCFEPDFAFNATSARALLRGYASVRPLSDAERRALPVLAAGAAMRFLLTRLFDWLNTPAGALVTRKDPLAYYRRLRFHLGIGDFHAYGL
jgi:homoserine kinase type II